MTERFWQLIEALLKRGIVKAYSRGQTTRSFAERLLELAKVAEKQGTTARFNAINFCRVTLIFNARTEPARGTGTQ